MAAAVLAAAPAPASADDAIHEGRARVKEALRAAKDWTPPANTVVYVVGGNFDYGWFHKRYMSPARTAAARLGLPVIDATINSNGSVKSNAARIRRDLRRILAERPGVTILVAANSKGYADWHEAMVDAPEAVRRAQGRIGVFALTPNWGGTRVAGFVLAHRWLERAVARLASRPRAPWDRRSLEDITPEARAKTIAGYRGKTAVETPLIVATAQLGRKRAQTDLIMSAASQIPSGVPHERWVFNGATHGSFTTAGFGWTRSTRLHEAALMEVHRKLRARAPRVGR